MFKLKAIDHIVLNVPDINRSLAFYMDVLGLEPERLDEFRRGAVRFPSVRISADLFPMKPIWELAFLNGVGPRVAESGLGLITGHAYSAPYEDLTLKPK